MQFIANVNSVCRLSVRSVRAPSQAIEIFGNVSMPLVHWPSVAIQVKFYVDRPRGTLRRGS